MVNKIKNLNEKIKIALVGKYVELHDAYISVVEALSHGGYANDCIIEMKWINAEEVARYNSDEIFSDVNGILVPGGFGDRGIEGKIEAIRWARENKKPLFGICLGMQCSVIEFARNVLEYVGANSSEIDPNTKYPVIDLMADQQEIENLGGTMRLGLYPCKLDKNSIVASEYDEILVNERHRHRYEFNNKFREELVEKGMNITGTSPDDRLVEIVEIKDHPWYVSVQFHPELKSGPNNPHPLFKGFIRAAIRDKESK